MKIIDGNNMLHREADVVGRGIHPVRHIFNKYCAPNETTIIVWDGAFGNNQRKGIYPDYKANRRPKEESKYKFFDMAKGVLQFTPVILIECPDWEADDVIGTLINQLHTKHKITVETNDGDYWQHNKMCYLPMIATKWHWLSPEELILWKATVGDQKDGIPGIKGFGAKSFKNLTNREKLTLIAAIKSGAYNEFEKIAKKWPKRITIDPKVFAEVQLYYKLNKYWEVPQKDIDNGTKLGKLNIAAANIFMEKFLI